MLCSEGRVVMVSGANRGIGLAVSNALYDAGYSLSLGARQRDSLQAVVEGWSAERVMTHRYEAEDRNTHGQWVAATVERFGRIDGLVNNAGLAIRILVEDDNDEALDRMWAINVKAPMSMIRNALPHLRRSGSGRIINVASLAGKSVRNTNVELCDDQVRPGGTVTRRPPRRLGGWSSVHRGLSGLCEDRYDLGCGHLPARQNDLSRGYCRPGSDRDVVVEQRVGG